MTSNYRSPLVPTSMPDEVLRTKLVKNLVKPSIVDDLASGEIKKVSSNVRQGYTPLGNGAQLGKKFTVKPQLKTYKPNTRWNSHESYTEGDSRNTGQWEVFKGIPISTFLNGTTGKTDFRNIPDDKMEQILKYLPLQATFLNAARRRPEFKNKRIVVEEGIYDYTEYEEEQKDDMTSLSSMGRAIGYAVKTFTNGTTDARATFALGEYFSTLPFYDKIVMDYADYYTKPDVGTRVFVVLPELDDEYSGDFARKTETRYNGNVQSEELMLIQS